MEKEIWQDIKGYEGLYQVSKLGRVKSLGNDKSRKEKILKPRKTGRGYLKVDLCKNGEIKPSSVQRLVAEAFIPNPEGKLEVDHINRIKTDNRVENLRWVTSKENKDNGQSKKVLCVETGIIYDSAHEASCQTGANPSHISKVCLGKRKTAGGYHWKFID